MRLLRQVVAQNVRWAEAMVKFNSEIFTRLLNQ